MVRAAKAFAWRMRMHIDDERLRWGSECREAWSAIVRRPRSEAPMTPSVERETFLRSDRLLARSVVRPVSRFLAIEASGGALLVAAALVAVVWANSPWSESYRSVWTSELTVSMAGHGITEDLRHWINDGLMTLFFFVIGLEIKGEIVSGQLRHARDAAVPLVGALGGMLVPAALFLAFNLGGPGSGVGACRWRRTSPSPSVSSHCSGPGCRASSRSSCSAWRSSTTSVPSW